MTYDVIIIGAGPAGLTAAIYNARANLKVLCIEGIKPGGQLMITTDVENFPGFPEGVQGPELMKLMRAQAERFKVEFITKDATNVDFTGKTKKVMVGEDSYEAKAVIIATGADAMWLGVPGEKEFQSKGVSACATCDGFFFKDKEVIVIGGGDTAAEEAIFLTRFCKKVTLIHRRDTLRASKIMQQRLFDNPKIEIIWDTEVIEFLGDERLKKAKLKNTKTNEESEMPIEGAFIAIGHKPNTKVFADHIEVDDKGYAVRKEHSMSSVDGVFVSGDVNDSYYRQAITAAGMGCEAAIDAERWLEANHQ